MAITKALGTSELCHILLQNSDRISQTSKLNGQFWFLRLMPYLIFKSSSTSLHISPPSRNLCTIASYPAWHVNSDPCIEKTKKSFICSTAIATHPWVNAELTVLNKCRSSFKQKWYATWVHIMYFMKWLLIMKVFFWLVQNTETAQWQVNCTSPQLCYKIITLNKL